MKLVDAFLPGADLWAAVNPAQAILLEGLAITALFAASGNPVRLRPLPIALTVLSWRLVFFPVSSRVSVRLDVLLLEAAVQTLAILLLARLIFGGRGSPAAPAVAALL